MKKPILITKDLFFIAKVREVALSVGAELTVVRSSTTLQTAIDAAAGDPLFLVDLEKPGIELDALASTLAPHLAQGAPCASFFSHIHENVALQANELNLGEVMPRSRFVKVLPELLKL